MQVLMLLMLINMAINYEVTKKLVYRGSSYYAFETARILGFLLK